MKKLVLGALVLLNLAFTRIHSNNKHKVDFDNHNQHSSSINKRDAVVYICNGPKAYAYHSHAGCSGLNNCSTQISAINLSDAINRGRRACQKCY